MSERVTSSYIKRIERNDPMRESFIQLVIPSLRQTFVISDVDLRRKYVCCFCNTLPDDSRHQFSRSTVSFTNYYAYLRHLSVQHRSQLPCDGSIFDKCHKENQFKCHICVRSFNRKEHLNAHLKSNAHTQKTNEINNLVNSSVNVTCSKTTIGSPLVHEIAEIQNSNTSITSSLKHVETRTNEQDLKERTESLSKKRKLEDQDDCNDEPFLSEWVKDNAELIDNVAQAGRTILNIKPVLIHPNTIRPKPKKTVRINLNN